jgi:Transposase DDE domain
MTINKKPKQLAGKIQEQLVSLCDARRLEALARQSHFIQRTSSKMTGQDFVALMTTEMLDDPAVSLGGLCDLLRQRNPQAVLTPQALHQRLNSPQAVTYMQEVFQLALRAQLAPLSAQLTPGLLAPFGRVFLEDSTQCRLHHKLADAFKGSGGSASSSSVKIDVIYDLRHHRLHDLAVTDGRAADQGHAAAIVPHLRADDLVIRDLGYFSLESLAQIATKQAWFLSRLSSTVAVYLSAEANEPALDVVDHVQQHADQGAVVELAGYLGQPRLPCRVLAYRLPEDVVEQRRRSAYETARKKGRTPTQASLHWLQFGWYITNVRPAIWAAAVVATVYRCRWQIELLFKQWKSLLHIHVLTGTRPERIKCLLYGRLTTIMMLMRICAYASWYAAVVLRRELSLHKLILWLKRKDRFAHAIEEGTVEILWSDLRRDMAGLLCKQKRKRQTSQQLLAGRRPSSESGAQRETMMVDQAA